MQRYYFELQEDNVDFAAILNEGVRPKVRDEDGAHQVFIVYTDGRPNEIARVEDVSAYEPGVNIQFIP